MRFILSIFIAVSGWILTGAYLLYEYWEYGNQLHDHLFNFSDIPAAVFHFFTLTSPVVSGALGYLVNDRMKLLEDMSELETRYKDYYDNAPHGYHSSDADMNIIDVNRTWLDMLGYGRDEVAGRMRVADVLTEEGVAKLNGIYPDFKRTGHMNNVELDFRRKDGTFLSVLMSATAIYDKDDRFLRSRTIVKDNTERKAYERALQSVAQEWKETFDSMPWGVMLIDSQHNVLRANGYISDLAGVPIREVVRKKCYELVHNSEEPPAGCLLKQRSNGKGATMMESFEPAHGRHFRMYCSPVEVDGKIASHVHSLVDITDMKEGEGKLLDSRDAFFNMLKDASAAYKEMKEMYNSLIFSFANAIDAKSHWTKGHSERVSNYAVALAREVGLKDKQINTLRVAALLHDIGKIGTYDYLLDKPARLTADEFETVKLHPAKSAEILGPIGQLRSVIDIVKYHHEKFDGSGYPDGLRGHDVPLMARILCVADSYDSMTADRPYRPAPGREYAKAELNRCAGSHFDPELVEAFMRVLDRNHF